MANPNAMPKTIPRDDDLAPSEDAWTFDVAGFLHLPATLSAGQVAENRAAWPSVLAEDPYQQLERCPRFGPARTLQLR